MAKSVNPKLFLFGSFSLLLHFLPSSPLNVMNVGSSLMFFGLYFLTKKHCQA